GAFPIVTLQPTDVPAERGAGATATATSRNHQSRLRFMRQSFLLMEECPPGRRQGASAGSGGPPQASGEHPTCHGRQLVAALANVCRTMNSKAANRPVFQSEQGVGGDILSARGRLRAKRASTKGSMRRGFSPLIDPIRTTLSRLVPARAWARASHSRAWDAP